MGKNKLHPGAKWIFRIESFFGWLILMIALSFWILPLIMSFSVSSYFRDEALFLFYLILILLAVIILVEIYSRLVYYFWSYEFTEDQLRIEKGIIWKKYSNIPYQRVQNVDITRGVIARLCGFSSVNIQTAGYSSHAGGRGGILSEGYIPAVPTNEAEKIREFVIKKITKNRNQGL